MLLTTLLESSRYRNIVNNLYEVVDGAYYPATIVGGSHIDVPAFRGASYQFDFHWPLQELAKGQKSNKAAGLKKFFDAILAEDNNPEIQASIEQANNTPGFWDWVAQQTPEVTTGKAIGERTGR